MNNSLTVANPPVQKFVAMPHQDDAIVAILDELQSASRTLYILPCGGGKTFIFIRVIEALVPGIALVLVPTRTLVHQTLGAYRLQHLQPDTRYLAICSDSPAENPEDEEHCEEVIPSTTDPEVVRQFLMGKSTGTRLIVSTYHSAWVVREAMGTHGVIDVAVYDEAHKTAGAMGKPFAMTLDADWLRIKRRVFTTATPRHTEIHGHGDRRTETVMYSMDNTDQYGRVAYSMTYQEAVRRGIVLPIKIVISVVTDEDVAQAIASGDILADAGHHGLIEMRQAAQWIALKQTMNTLGLKKAFTFHDTVASAVEFSQLVNMKHQDREPPILGLHVNGEQAHAQRVDAFRAFQNADRAVITNARCLTEGVDVPAVDIVAFNANRRSVTDIVQAAGRCQRRAPGKTAGYVLLPVFIQKQENETLEEAVERVDLGEIGSILRTLVEQDETMIAQIRNAEVVVTKGQDSPEIEPEDLNDADITDVIDALIDRDPTLTDRIREAVVPATGIDVREGMVQDTIYRLALQDHRVMMSLKEAALTMERPDCAGMNLEALVDTVHHCLDTHGNLADLVVPVQDTNDSGRVMIMGNTISIERIAKSIVPLALDHVQTGWEQKYDRYKEDVTRHGRGYLPRNRNQQHDPYVTWCQRQRLDHHNGRLAAERFEQLDQLGFPWGSKPASSKTRHLVQQLVESLQRHSGADGKGFDMERSELQLDAGTTELVKKMRRIAARGGLSNEDRDRLEKAGMVWETLDQRARVFAMKANEARVLKHEIYHRDGSTTHELQHVAPHAMQAYQVLKEQPIGPDGSDHRDTVSELKACLEPRTWAEAKRLLAAINPDHATVRNAVLGIIRRQQERHAKTILDRYLDLNLSSQGDRGAAITALRQLGREVHDLRIPLQVFQEAHVDLLACGFTGGPPGYGYRSPDGKVWIPSAWDLQENRYAAATIAEMSQTSLSLSGVHLECPMATKPAGTIGLKSKTKPSCWELMATRNKSVSTTHTHQRLTA